MDDAKGALRRTRVLVVEELEVVRVGLRALLGGCADFEVVGDAACASDALRKTIMHRPGVVITEARLRDSCGVALCREIKAAVPGIKVVMLTGRHTDDVLRDSIAAGADGYVLKRWRCNDLIAKLREVSSAGEAPDPLTVRQLMARTREMTGNSVTGAFTQLSAQEVRVLTLLSEGKTNSSIAAALALGTGTVRNYVSSVLSKLNVRNRAEAAAYAATHRLHEFV